MPVNTIKVTKFGNKVSRNMYYEYICIMNKDLNPGRESGDISPHFWDRGGYIHNYPPPPPHTHTHTLFAKFMTTEA